MTINLKLKNLLAVALLSSFSCFTAASVEENKGPAPEATAAQAAISFWDLPYLKEAFIDTTPADRKDALVVGELGVDGGNKTMILQLAQELADNSHGDYDSLLIAHKGKLLFESYYKRGRINLPHFQASATKGYTSLLLGRAIELGYLTMADLDKPLVSLVKGLDSTKFVDGVEKITLHQVMTMRSGLRFSDEQITEFRENPKQFSGLNQIKAFLELSEPVTPESQTIKYQGSDPLMVMQVLDAVVPGTAKDFIKNEFLDKLGINNYSWRDDPSGMPIADSRVSITSRDMLKLGALVINEGQWNGEQLLSANYLTKATSAMIPTKEDWQPKTFNYGYLWYQTNLTAAGKSYDVKITWGAGGNRVIAIDELDLVVAITGHDREDATIFTRVAEIILPAFIQDSTTAMSANSDKQGKFPLLEGPYIGQTPPGLTPKVFAPVAISSEYRDWGGTFSPDMKEYYFGRRNNESGKTTSVVYKNVNNRWHETVLGPRENGFISPDGKTMHIGKRYRERTDNGWSELKSLGSPFDDIRIMRLTASSKGTYVFDEATRDGNGVLRYSQLVDGKREAPKPLSKEINTGKWTAHPFIAPDESYIIWDSENDGGYGDSDMYISFKQQDGSWGAAINFGDKINTEGEDGGGKVTPDGKYLFFCRRCTPPDFEVMWVDAKIIETLRHKS